MKNLIMPFFITCAFLCMTISVSAQNIDTVYYETGEISSIGSYDSNGLKTGTRLYFWESGIKNHEGSYANNNKIGEWNFYNRDGELEEIWVYRSGKLIEQKLPDGSPVLVSKVETMPEFPGRDVALMNFLGNNIRYPKKARKRGIEGEVVASFKIWEDGSVRDIRILKSVYPSLDAEVVRVINAMPKWKPATQYGKAVIVEYNLPVRFRLPKK